MEIKVTQPANGPSFEGLSLNEASANARLIAAAPELLEAAEALAKQMERMASIAHFDLSANKGYVAAKAAIAKARGQA